MLMITVEQKDLLVNYIASIEGYPRYNIEFSDVMRDIHLGPDVVVPVIRQMERMGIIAGLRMMKDGASFLHDTAFDDFVRHGAFAAQEAFFKENVIKLELEVKALTAQLEPDVLERTQKILDIAKSISALGAALCGL